MDGETDDRFYTFVGVRPDGARPVVELRPCPSDDAAMRSAALWVSDHKSCARAEVWREGELVGYSTDDAHGRHAAPPVI
jgi:hypothetical protein